MTRLASGSDITRYVSGGGSTDSGSDPANNTASGGGSDLANNNNTTLTGATNPFNQGFGGGAVDEATSTPGETSTSDSSGGVNHVTTATDQTPTNALQDALNNEASTTNQDYANLNNTAPSGSTNQPANQPTATLGQTEGPVRDVKRWLAGGQGDTSTLLTLAAAAVVGVLAVVESNGRSSS